MWAITTKMQADSVQMMKSGWPLRAVVEALVRAGADPRVAEAYVADLVRMKREAETAGVAAPPDPRVWCAVCRVPIDPRTAFLDPEGNRICKSCQSGFDLDAAERRVQMAALESSGVPLCEINQNPHGAESALFAQWSALRTREEVGASVALAALIGDHVARGRRSEASEPEPVLDRSSGHSTGGAAPRARSTPEPSGDGDRFLLFVEPVGFMGWVHPYDTLGVRADAAQGDVRRSLGLRAPGSDEEAAALSVLSSPERRLAWHVVGLPLWGGAGARPHGRLGVASATLAEVLRRELAGDAAKAEHLWPAARAAIVAAVKSPETPGALTALATTLGIDSAPNVAARVLAAIDRELLAGLHTTLLCAADLGQWTGRADLQESWEGSTARGAPSENLHARVPAALRPAMIDIVSGMGAMRKVALRRALEFANALPYRERFELRGTLIVLSSWIPSLLQSSLDREVVQLIGGLVEACPFTVKLFNALAGAHFTFGSALCRHEQMRPEGTWHLARAAAIVPEFDEPRNVLRAAMNRGDVDAQTAAALEEARAFLDSDDARALAQRRHRAAAFDIVAGVGLAPSEENAEAVARAARAYLDHGERASDPIVARAFEEQAATRLRKLLQTSVAGGSVETIALRALEAQPPRLWSGTTELGVRLARGFIEARSRVPPHRVPAIDTWILNRWSRGAQDWGYKAVAVAGAIAVVVGGVKTLSVARHRDRIDEAYAAFVAADRGTDRREVRRAAGRYLATAGPAEDPGRRAAVAAKWRTALLDTLQEEAGNDEARMRQLAMELEVAETGEGESK